MANIRVLLVDGFNLIRRVYEAHHRDDSDISECIESCVRSLTRALNTHRPTHAVVVLDSHETTWRHLLYADYKGGRKPTPDVLINNLDGFQRAFEKTGVQSMEVSGYEADDVIATLAVGVARGGGDSIILSTDKGFLSLLGEHIQVYHHFEQHFVTAEDVIKKYSLRHDQLIDFWSLCGDPGNNIKGVPGVGKKTAGQLMEKYDSLETILAQARDLEDVHASDADPEVRADLDAYLKPLAKVLKFEDEALKCRLLLMPKLDVELGINLKAFRLA